MILAAGRGVRLKPLTDHTPKPMLAVGDAPLISHQLRWLADAGIGQVVINLHHLGEQIEGYVGDGKAFGLQVAYSREAHLLETGGGLVKALPLLGNAPFWLLNGDIHTDFPFRQFPVSLPKGILAHMLLTPKPRFRAKGDFNWRDGKVIGQGDDYVFCGLALLHPALVQGRRATPFSLREPYLQAVAAGAVSAQIWPGWWTDIGTPDQLEAVRRRQRGKAGGDRDHPKALPLERKFLAGG